LSRFPRSDASVLLATLVLTVIFDLVVAVQVGMVLAAILFIRRISETTEVSRVTDEDMLERPEQLACGKPLPEGVLVYRIFGPFLFGAAEKLMDALTRTEYWPHVLVLRLHLVTAMDTTGMNALLSVVERMRNSGGSVIISGIHRQPLNMLIKSNAIDKIGRSNLCATFDDAIGRAQQLCK
jgi:SulP family sulfate permease